MYTESITYQDGDTPLEAYQMDAAGADWHIHTFSNTMHAFTNPDANDKDMGTVYNALSAKRAWHEMVDFFKEIF